ncbi:MAG: ribonuclease III [Acidobacteriia bacterium]|nr:ribonuclease III [Terriglobia bacterium]
MGERGDLEARLGYRFKDGALLLRALTHRSGAHEGKSLPGEDWERLEFLGDALLGFFVADWLLRHDPLADEGVLTRRKQSVVRSEALALAARRIGLGEALRLGRGEESTGGREKPSLLADAFEGVLGAVYVDGGIRAARSFVARHLARELESARKSDRAAEDYKTRLQERVQARTRQTPSYRVVAAHGPAHSREFEAEVLLDGEVLGAGRGASRKQAEQEAARVALGGPAGGGEEA